MQRRGDALQPVRRSAPDQARGGSGRSVHSAVVCRRSHCGGGCCRGRHPAGDILRPRVALGAGPRRISGSCRRRCLPRARFAHRRRGQAHQGVRIALVASLVVKDACVRCRRPASGIEGQAIGVGPPARGRALRARWLCSPQPADRRAFTLALNRLTCIPSACLGIARRQRATTRCRARGLGAAVACALRALRGSTTDAVHHASVATPRRERSDGVRNNLQLKLSMFRSIH